MKVAGGWSMGSLLERWRANGRPYLEFEREESMSVGLYVLPAGGRDEQQPHDEDEVYVVLEGEARFTAGDEVRDIRAGDVIFVSAGVPHRFHDMTSQLKLIAVFAPPEGSRPEGSAAR
jgi:mannose-6-phosphate isomerase-like protein (cupin superfamily)